VSTASSNRSQLRLAEPVQQQLGHVLQAGCAVEVHEERFHREHRWSVPAPSSL
jgi:hypothetical protein